jgi:threonine/homoserine/homoserine lactone efflux protein
MSKILAVLPLALTMNLGPQIITAITLILAKDPVKKSLYYLLAILIAATSVTLAAFFVFEQLGTKAPATTKSTGNPVMDYIFAGLLVALGVYVFLNRKKNSKPKWLSTIQEADTKRIFMLGLFLYSFFPTDLICNLTVGRYLASHNMNFYSMFPFLALTLFIAALPILSYLLFKRRAERVMPKVQEWLDSNAWVVNELVIVFFICMTLFT